MPLKDERFRELENANELFVALGSFAIVAALLIALVFHSYSIFSDNSLAKEQMVVKLEYENHLKEIQFIVSTCDLGIKQKEQYSQITEISSKPYQHEKLVEEQGQRGGKFEMFAPRLSTLFSSTFTHS